MGLRIEDTVCLAVFGTFILLDYYTFFITVLAIEIREKMQKIKAEARCELLLPIDIYCTVVPRLGSAGIV